MGKCALRRPLAVRGDGLGPPAARRASTAASWAISCCAAACRGKSGPPVATCMGYVCEAVCVGRMAVRKAWNGIGGTCLQYLYKVCEWSDVPTISDDGEIV